MTGSLGNTLLAAADFTSGNSWRIVGAAKFTGYVSGAYHSYAYLVWEDPVAGAAQFWYESCTNCLASNAAPVYLGAVSVSGSNTWRIVATADFNQDGFPDLVWQNPSTGGVQFWFMGGSSNGATVMSTAQVTAGNSWHVVSAANYNGDGSPIMIWQPPGSATVQIWFMNVQ